MSKVIANMSMSLDGFIADPADGIDHLFGWMGNGDVEVPTAIEQVKFRMSQASAEYMRDAMAEVGALIAGRHLFDITHGWGGTHPMGVPVIVVTHEPPAERPENFTFAGSVEEAVRLAKEAAGEKNVVIASAKIAQQALAAGLVDGIYADLVPVILGEGVRWFDNLGKAPIRLEGPAVIEGNGVTHLAYEVVKR